VPAAEPTLLYVMKQLELAVRSRLDDIVRPAGLTALQYTALTVLERRPDLTSSQLARRYRSKVAALQREMLHGLSTTEADELRRSLLVCRTNLAGRHAT
jgi:hypothetical protein